MTTSATRGGQVGNDNAVKPRVLSDALRKYAIQNPSEVERFVKSLWNKAADGDIPAAKELLDRLEGKPMQAIEQKTEHSGTISIAQVPELTKEEWLDAHGLGKPARPAK